MIVRTTLTKKNDFNTKSHTVSLEVINMTLLMAIVTILAMML